MAPSLSSGSGAAPSGGAPSEPAAPAAEPARREAPTPQADPQKDLFKAVKLAGRHQCLAGIYAALSAGAQAAATNSRGSTALHLAACHNPDAEAVAAAIAALVAEGANVDAPRNNVHQGTALHFAALNPRAAAAAAAVRALAAAGAKMCRDAEHKEPLHWVAYQDSAEAAAAVVQALCAAGGDVNAGRSFTPLHVVVQHSSAAVAAAAIPALVAAGGDVRRKNSLGREPIHDIAYRTSADGVPAVLQALVAAGASADATTDDGLTPLHLIAWRSGASVAAAAIPALVAAGGDVRSKDRYGDQPLHIAIKCNRDSTAVAAAAAALVSAGADPHAPNGQGRLPIELALEREDAAECAELLRVLLGEATTDGAGPRNAAGQAAADGARRSNAGQAGGEGAGPSLGGSSGVQQVLKLAAAAVRQVAKGKRKWGADEQAALECPVCLDAPPCMAASCGHTFCAKCAELPAVLEQCPVCCQPPQGPMLRLFL